LSKIYKRKNSPYWQYTSGDGPGRIQRSTGQRDKKVALLIRSKWDHEYALVSQGIIIKKYTIQQCYHAYVNQVQTNKGPNWGKRIVSALNNFLRVYPDFTNRDMTSLSIQEYMTVRKEEGRAPKTIKEEYKIIKSWCDWLIAMEMLKSNPCNNLVTPKVVQVKPRTSFTQDEVYDAIDKARLDKDKIFWEILYKTGLRAGDACKLSNDHFNGMMIDLRQSKTSKNVVVPLHNDLASKDIIGVMNYGGIGRSRQRLKEILPQGDLHTFRHSFASHLEEYGATRWDTKCLLGHNANDVTAQYVTVNVDRLRPIINKL